MSQCAFAVRGEMPSTWPISSFDSPCAISSITSRCRGVIIEESRSACMPATVPSAAFDQQWPKGVFSRLGGVFSCLGGRPFLRRAGRDPALEERRLVAALVRRPRLVLVEGADAEQQLELVAQVRAHHL